MPEINGWEDLRKKVIEEEFSNVPMDSRNNAEFERRVNARVWENIRERLLGELQGRGISFGTIEHDINESTTYWTRDERGLDGKGVYEIEIPIGQEFSNNQNPFDERDLFGIVYSLFHEYRHIEQREHSIYNPINTEENRGFARAALIQMYFSEYDDANYANDPREVDAQLYGIEQALIYIRENYPWIDVEKCCVDYVRSFISSQKENGFTELSFSEDASDSSEQILQDLRERKNNQRRTKLTEEMKSSEFYEGFKDEDLEKDGDIYKKKQLRKKFTADFIKKYNECQSAKEKDSMLVSAILEIYPEAMQEYPILKMEKNKGGKSMMTIEEVREKIKRNREKISRNGADIADCEKEIEQLEKEIKELKQQGQSTYTQVLAKRLQISELENEIIGIQSASDRLAKGIILADSQYIKKDGKQYQEHLYLSECYTNYYEVQNLEAVRESLELKMRIMVANKQQNSQEYRDLQEELKRNEQTLSMYRKSLDKAVQIYATQGGKQGTDIDFSIPYTDILEQYERESQNTDLVKRSYDIQQLADDISTRFAESDDKQTAYLQARGETTEIFSNGLNGTSKELAEIYGEMFAHYSVYEDTSATYTVYENTMFEESSRRAEKALGTSISMPEEIIKRDDNDYIIVYTDEKGQYVGIPCSRNQESGELEVKNGDGTLISQKEMAQIRERVSNKGKITFDQMEMQVVRHNIEKSIQDGRVTEIVEVTDPKMVQYLNQQNGLNKYSARNDALKVYMISRQDEEGNSHYEFVAHNGSQGYTKLEGLQQVPNKQSSIIIDGARISGQPTPMQRVDCTFVDRDGNSYFAYHQFGQGEMALSYSEQGKENMDKVEVSKDSGLNKMLHNSRVRSLMRAGYNAMGIGYEKVKSMYNKFRGKDKENEVENTRED